MRAGAIAALVVVVLVAAAHRSADEPADVTDSSTREHAYTSVTCGENAQAFDVEPDTDQARADAQAWCTRSGEWIDNAPWPSGVRPAPLPIDISSGN